MPRSTTALTLFCLITVIGSSLQTGLGQQEGAEAKTDEVLPLCKILASPEQYRNKRVSVRGTYRVGLEASELYCLSCSEKGSVWVEFDTVEGGDKAARALGRLMHNKLGTVNGVFSGTFHPEGSFGHLGAYRHQLSVGSVSDLTLIDRVGLPPSRLKPESRRKVCQ